MMYGLSILRTARFLLGGRIKKKSEEEKKKAPTCASWLSLFDFLYYCLGFLPVKRRR
jgi:hypothetical protein